MRTTIFAERALTARGWQDGVLVRIDAQGFIAAVEADAHAPAGEAVHRASVLLPAPSNVHSHTFQRAMAGLSEAAGPDRRDSFWTWRTLMYRFVDALTPDDIEAVAAFAFMEMAEAGYAGVGEFHYLHHGPDGAAHDDVAETGGRIVEAARLAGIGLTLLPVLYQRGGCDGRPLQGGQKRFGNDPDCFADLWQASAGHVARLGGDARIGVAPHSLRAVDASGLQAATALCPDGPIHIHLAEQVAEVAEVEAHLGARPARWLMDHHAVDGRWCPIHCTHLDDGEVDALAASGAVAGLCPVTEANLGDGIFRGEDFAGRGGRFGVGTDSNIAISLSGELAMLEYGQRLALRRRAVLAEARRSVGRLLWEKANAGGAQALGRHAGAIAPGRLADLVELDGDDPRLAERRGDALIDTFVFAAPGGGLVRNVWSAGRHVVVDGRHARREAIAAGYLRCMRGLAAR